MVSGCQGYTQEIAVHGLGRIGKPLGQPPPVSVESKGPVRVKAPVDRGGGLYDKAEVALVQVPLISRPNGKGQGKFKAVKNKLITQPDAEGDEVQHICPDGGGKTPADFAAHGKVGGKKVIVIKISGPAGVYVGFLDTRAVVIKEGNQGAHGDDKGLVAPGIGGDFYFAPVRLNREVRSTPVLILAAFSPAGIFLGRDLARQDHRNTHETEDRKDDYQMFAYGHAPSPSMHGCFYYIERFKAWQQRENPFWHTACTAMGGHGRTYHNKQQIPKVTWATSNCKANLNTRCVVINF